MSVVRASCLLAAVLFSLAFAETGRATDGLTVAIVPDKVSLEAAGSQQVLVIVSNGTSTPVKNVAVSWLPAPQVEVKPATAGNGKAQPPTLKMLAKGADAARTFDISAKPAARAQKLFVRVDYKSGGASKVATASIDFENAGPEKIEDVAAVDVKTTLESLDGNNPGVVYLVVTNKLATPLTVDQVTATGPDSVEFTGPDKAVPIGARQSAAIEVSVKAKSRVRPGKYLLLFDLHLKWGDDRQGRIITTQQTQIGIAGESAVLTLLGIPSFLLLPGFLIMLAIATWWRFGVLRPGGAPAQPPFDLTKSDFWALAVTASIIVGFLYPALGGVDYFHDAYGLIDVVIVWIASLLAGSAIWFLVMGTRRVRYERRTPRTSDEPETLIQRLGRQKLKLERPRYKFGTAPDDFVGYVVQRRGDAASVWLAPPISIVVTGNGNGSGSGKLIDDLGNATDAKELGKLIKSHRGQLTINWDNANGPSHPYTKTAAELAAASEQPAERIARSS